MAEGRLTRGHSPTMLHSVGREEGAAGHTEPRSGLVAAPSRSYLQPGIAGMYRAWGQGRQEVRKIGS